MAPLRSWLVVLAALLLVCVAGQEIERESDTQYITPTLSGPVHFLETFNDDHWGRLWKPSTDPKYTGDWEVQESEYVRVSGDRGLVVADVAKHHAIAAQFEKPLDTTDKDLVVQYEVQWQHGMTCGGAYMKILTATPDLDITRVNGDTPYTIMFGPDKCDDDKVHFIVRHENPVNHTIEEKHLMPRPHIKIDKLTHLFTLWVRNDNTFELSIDREVVKAGSLFEDFKPAFNPPKEIDDTTDSKPADWVDAEFIADPEAVKPDDWDESEPAKINDPNDKKPENWLDNEPEMIADPNAKKPEDWNDEEDGEWLAAEVENPKCQEVGCGEWKPYQIQNPKYKGKWSAPQIKNPAWIGIWTPRQIPNPHYFEDPHPSNFAKMGGIAFELWTMTDGVLFDNILIGHDKKVADDFAEATWSVKHENELKKLESEQPQAHGESWVEMAERYINLAFEFAQENPILLASSVVLGLVPVFICIALSGPSKKPATPQPTPAEETSTPPKAAKVAKPSKKEEQSGSEKEEEIQPDSGEETKKSPTPRKRVPRADH